MKPKINSDIQHCLKIASPTDENFVHTSSRNGYLLWRLGSICGLSSSGKNLYLLDDVAILDTARLEGSILIM